MKESRQQIFQFPRAKDDLPVPNHDQSKDMPQQRREARVKMRVRGAKDQENAYTTPSSISWVGLSNTSPSFFWEAWHQQALSASHSEIVVLKERCSCIFGGNTDDVSLNTRLGYAPAPPPFLHRQQLRTGTTPHPFIAVSFLRCGEDLR